MKPTPSFRAIGHAFFICMGGSLIAVIAGYLDSLLLHTVAVAVAPGGVALAIRGLFLSNKPDGQ